MSGQERGALHGPAVVGVEHELVWADAFPDTGPGHQLGCVLGRLRLVHLPLHDLAAPHVHDQVEVEEDPTDRRLKLWVLTSKGQKFIKKLLK